LEIFLTILSSKDGKRLKLSFRELILKKFGLHNRGVLFILE